jgi:cell division protein FtsB
MNAVFFFLSVLICVHLCSPSSLSVVWSAYSVHHLDADGNPTPDVRFDERPRTCYTIIVSLEEVIPLAKRKGGRRFSPTWFVVVIGLVIALYLAIDLGRMILTVYDLKQMEKALGQEITQLEVEIEDLDRRIAELQTDVGMERAIRDHLRWGKEGDILISVPTPAQ